jgi:L-rhamnose mutarotase
MYKRFCKTLTLKDDEKLIEEYVRLHSPENCWPEIAEGMKQIGILDMEIYRDGNRLFMIMDTIADFNHDEAFNRLATLPRQKEWEAFMSKFQDVNASEDAAEKWRIIGRIYKL